jgi:tRNA (pseudouridine54-N1)-methyltransferase
MDLTILLDAPRARTTDDFLLRDLPGTSGRLDVVCRVLISTYRSVPAFAPNIKFLTIFGGPPTPPIQLDVNGLQPNQIPESELACALILKTLLFLHRTKNQGSSNQWPGFTLSPKDFNDTLTDIIQPPTQCLYLVEEGVPLEQVALTLEKPLLLVLGDDQGLPTDHETLVLEHPVQKVSMGTRSLLGSQVVSLFLLELAHRMELNTASP